MTPGLTIAALLIMALAAGPLFPELRRPPDERFDGLPKVLVNARGAPVTHRRTWKGARATWKRKWQAILGPFPARTPLEPEVLSTELFPDHSRLLLRYRADPAWSNEAYLLIPAGQRKKRPGMVVLHQTTRDHAREAVGISGREPMHIALHLVRRGYVCIAPRNFLWSIPAASYQEATGKVLATPPWKTGMAKMLWDAMRATDLLAARPEVDPERIGSIGHSLGGKEVLYHAAFDERVRAAVSCEGGIGLSFSNWEADWYLGPQIQAPSFDRDHHEVLALVAPRPFLLVGGESADGARSWPYIEANLPVWRLFGAEERLGLLRHGGGHDFPAPGPERDLIYGWLDHWLADSGS